MPVQEGEGLKEERRKTMKRQVTFYQLGPWSKNPAAPTDKYGHAC